MPSVVTEYYTHVGSRNTPEDILMLMTRFAALQNRRPRSGGAAGADETAEANDGLIAYLPWCNFRHKQGEWDYGPGELRFADSVLEKAFPYDIGNLKRATLAFFRRNVFQVLGRCKNKDDIVLSKFVICWTPDGATSIDDYDINKTGGTGIAINVASLYNVPVYNLSNQHHRQRVERWCSKKEVENGIVFDTSSWRHKDSSGNNWLNLPF